jgi:hypothetical protein
MPQLSKGGKFVFGWSIVQNGFSIQIPNKTVDEYRMSEKVILMSGSKTSGAFSVSSSSLLSGTLYGDLLKSLPELLDYSMKEGIPVKQKNRFYCWVNLNSDNRIVLTKEAASLYQVQAGDSLLSIRGSDIAFDFAVKGPLVELAKNYPVIPVFE